MKIGGTGVISSDAAFFWLTVDFSILFADRLGSGDQLVDARLGDLQLRRDFPDGITLQLFQLKRSRNAGIFCIHHRLDDFVLHFRSDLLVHKGAADRFVSCLDKLIPADDGSLLLVLVGAGDAGNGVRAFDECLSFTGDGETCGSAGCSGYAG